ncbi:HpcH/HpaI aldolase/citrate lyase family protein [Sphingomonas sp.]|uniref:HpcH/HpaI aldolase/citrate lyase family protein n=1 Tax=Sphingomonas sp. TaxID=28214 RepID=UPI002DD63A98|nr:CoA ester lyase [Sphingomonas sp.]
MTQPPRTALFLPASNPRAIEKARTLDADMVILDLEDAVAPDAKADARTASVAAVAQGFGDRLVAIRVNGVGTADHAADLKAVAGSAAGWVVLPKAEDADACAAVAAATNKPLLAMIETPRGVLAAPAIAAAAGVAGLIAGTNDLRAELCIPPSASRDSLSASLQVIVLAARAGGAWAIDGVFNALADAAGLDAECRAGRALGFDGKSLIHPNQIAVANVAFGPTKEEVEDARALVEAFAGGAERFRDRMIEAMHVAQARDLLARVTH